MSELDVDVKRRLSCLKQRHLTCELLNSEYKEKSKCSDSIREL